MTRAQRERMINAVLFFIEKTTDCTERKLFSLLYLLDVSCFQQTGQIVTGLDYSAVKSGPCPHVLKFALEEMRPELRARIQRETSHAFNTQRQVYRATGEISFDADQLTERHLELMSFWADKFGSARGRDIDINLYDCGAWAKARARGIEQDIRFGETLSAEDPNSEALLAIAADQARRTARLSRIAA